nr:hypothetical protein BaRGS_009911 [Batillaria attramentaria]
MSDDVYLDIVARVVGPATSVAVYCAVPPRLRIQTFIDSTACIEGKLARLVLTPDQLTLLSAEHDLVMLTGPTGTGKTAWLREGHDVHIPSTLPSTKASSRLLYYQLQLTLSEDPTMPSTAGKVHLHLFDICNAPGDKERVVNTLASASKDQELFVLMDEIPMTSRCTPRILKEVQDALSRTDVAQYSISGTPSPSDGPNIIQLRHQGAGHTGRWPVECFLCGQEVARVLKELHVGETGGDITKGGSKVSDTPLMYRDVFVLTRSSELHDRIFVIPPSRFVSGLRAEGIPVTVLGRPLFCLSMEEWERALVKVVTAQTDEVAVVDYRSIAGLERKVVVLLRGFDEYMDNSLGERGARLFDVVHGFSRCTSQLVVVEVPR